MGGLALGALKPQNVAWMQLSCPKEAPDAPAFNPPLQDLTPEQKSLYDEMRKGIASNFNAFKVEREDGALMGPWNPWLHEPAIGKAIWDLTPGDDGQRDAA